MHLLTALNYLKVAYVTSYYVLYLLIKMYCQ